MDDQQAEDGQQAENGGMEYARGTEYAMRVPEPLASAAPPRAPSPATPRRGVLRGKAARRAGWLLLAAAALSFLLYPALLGFVRAAEVRRSEQVVQHAVPDRSLTRSDGEILLVWCYVPVRLGPLVENCALDGDVGDACSQISTLRSIAECLPTSPKYRPMTDSVLALVHQREQVALGPKRERYLPVEAVRAAHSMEPFGGEIQCVTGADPAWKKAVLDRYFGSL